MTVNIETKLVSCKQMTSSKGTKYYKAVFCTPDAESISTFIFTETLDENDVDRLSEFDFREFVIPDDITLKFKYRKEK